MNRILEILQGIRPDCDFQASTKYIDDGLLDSLDIMTLVAELEEQYQIKIQVTDIIPENYQNAETIANLIQKRGGTVQGGYCNAAL